MEPRDVECERRATLASRWPRSRETHHAPSSRGPARTADAASSVCREPFGRVALRTLPGTLTISGLTHPAVRLITIATERGVRTLAPSPRAGAFVAVFDGDFPAASIELIATMADGSTVTQSLETGF